MGFMDLRQWMQTLEKEGELRRITAEVHWDRELWTKRAELEKLVRDALELVEIQNGAARPDRLPPDFFARIAREFGSGPFERPAQGEFEKRDPW